MIRRREFITLLGGSAATWSLAARAQQPAMPVIGFLSTKTPGEDAHLLAAFHRGLKEEGYVEGQNVVVEYRFAENENGRLPALVADFVRRRVNVIVANGPAALAAKAATTTIPIVFMTGADPVQLGFVASLSRPGGNLTGVTALGDSLGPKRLELLQEMVPTATIIALLNNPANPTAESQSIDMQAAARTLDLQLHVLLASSQRDFDTVFEHLLKIRASALVIATAPIFNSNSKHLAALTLRNAVPAVYQYRQFAAAGGLMSYGSDNTDSYRIVGAYTGRILRGEKPADLPVQQATKVELTINMKTAKALGLTVPLSLLGRADEVIE